MKSESKFDRLAHKDCNLVVTLLTQVVLFVSLKICIFRTLCFKAMQQFHSELLLINKIPKARGHREVLEVWTVQTGGGWL